MADDAAARVEFVIGTAHIVSATGEKREAEKGTEINAGETVVSEDARVQLRFTDGGYISLLPRSEFRINAYSYSGKPDGSEHISMALLKGGLRTITGMIGKTIRSAYEMVTGVATIGIRGTEYSILYGDGVSGTVSRGAIAVCNAGGCIDVAQGQSYYVRDESTKPVFTKKAADLPPQQPRHASTGNDLGHHSASHAGDHGVGKGSRSTLGDGPPFDTTLAKGIGNGNWRGIGSAQGGGPPLDTTLTNGIGNGNWGGIGSAQSGGPPLDTTLTNGIGQRSGSGIGSAQGGGPPLDATTPGNGVGHGNGNNGRPL